MNDFVTRARNALERITANAEEGRHINGLLGRLNSDGSTTFTPVGLPRHKFVRIRNSSGSQTTIVARDDAGVPESSGLAVRLRVIHSVPNSGVVQYAIVGIVRDDALATMPAPPPGGVPPHIHDERYFRENEFINVSVGAVDAGKPVVLDAGGKLDATFIDSEDIADIVGTMVTGNTETDIAVTYQDADNTLDFVVSSTLVADRITAAATDDTIADADLWGYVTGGVLVKTAWSNIKAVFKTYFDTLYVDLGGTQTITGQKTFSTLPILAGVLIDGTAGIVSDLIYRVGGVSRWVVRRSNDAESGSDAGSNFQLISRTDAGALLATVITAIRATGYVGLLKTPAAELDVNGYIRWNGLKRVSTQFDKTNTTLATVTGLSVNVKAATNYHFRVVLFIDASAGGGHKVAIGGTATATAIIYQVLSVNNGTGAFAVTSRQTALGGAGGQTGATTVYCVVEGEITVNAAGTLLVQFAQNAASGTSSVLVGSTFEVNEMA